MNVEKDLDNLVQRKILKEKKPKVEFTILVKKFEKLLKDFNPIENCIEIKNLFKKGNGIETILKQLKTKDFKGIYIFIHGDKPFYVGISKGVIKRVLQHVKGYSHCTATLAYKMGKLRYKFENGIDHPDTRKRLTFDVYCEPGKIFLMEQKIAWLKIKDDNELYLFEVFCSMKYKIFLNTFETH